MPIDILCSIPQRAAVGGLTFTHGGGPIKSSQLGTGSCGFSHLAVSQTFCSYSKGSVS